MSNPTNLIALIPARGGSKGLRRKNILLLNQKPLIVYTIEAALQTGVFSNVFVSTEDGEIENISRASGACIIQRPIELAGDETEMHAIIEHTYEVLKSLKDPLGTHFCLLQPTSPLRTAQHIKDCVKDFFSKKEYASAVSICENSCSPYKYFRFKDGQMIPLMGLKYLGKNRQQLEKTYRQNGAIYIASWKDCLREKRIIHTPMMPYLMNQEESIDVDRQEDLGKIERIMRASVSLDNI